MSDRWLSVNEIADHIGVSRDTIYRWIDEKKIPAHKIGRLWKFKTEEVDAWVREGKGADDPAPSSPQGKKEGR